MLIIEGLTNQGAALLLQIIMDSVYADETH